MSSKWKTGKYVFEMLTPKPKVKIKGQKTTSKVKLDASKAGLESAKFHLDRTFSKTEKSLKKLKETTEETKRYLLNLPPKKK